MASRYVYRLREESRGKAGAILFLWALVVTYGACRLIVANGRHSSAGEWAILGASLTTGVLLGYRRRLGAVWIAPVILYPIAFVPVLASNWVAHGFVGGLVRSFLELSFLWPLVAAGVVALLLVTALPLRLLVSSRRQSDVVIYGPGETPN